MAEGGASSCALLEDSIAGADPRPIFAGLLTGVPAVADVVRDELLAENANI